MENQTPVFHRSHRPLEIAHPAISTFPQRIILFLPSKQKTGILQGRGKVEIPNSGIPTFPPPHHVGAERRRSQQPRKEYVYPCSFRPATSSRTQAHLALESNPGFRLMPRWNQFSISGSFPDWKMLPVAKVRQAECLPHHLPQAIDATWWRRRFRLNATRFFYVKHFFALTFRSSRRCCLVAGQKVSPRVATRHASACATMKSTTCAG